MLYLLMKHCVSCLIYYVRLTLIRNEMVLLFSLHTQLARDAGSKNSFKFRCVGPACYGHDAFWPSPRIARFLPASWPVQRSSVEVTLTSPPPPPHTHTHIPWWQLTLHTLIVPAVAVSSHNVIPRVGTMGMQCEYFLTLASETINQGLKASKEMLSLEDTEVYSQQGSTLLQNSLSDQK